METPDKIDIFYTYPLLPEASEWQGEVALGNKEYIREVARAALQTTVAIEDLPFNPKVERQMTRPMGRLAYKRRPRETDSPRLFEDNEGRRLIKVRATVLEPRAREAVGMLDEAAVPFRRSSAVLLPRPNSIDQRRQFAGWSLQSGPRQARVSRAAMKYQARTRRIHIPS